VVDMEITEQDVRNMRDWRLFTSDWSQLVDNQLTDQQKQDWAVYRQQLRDLPNNPNWPDVDFPDPPA